MLLMNVENLYLGWFSLQGIELWSLLDMPNSSSNCLQSLALVIDLSQIVITTKQPFAPPNAQLTANQSTITMQIGHGYSASSCPQVAFKPRLGILKQPHET